MGELHERDEGKIEAQVEGTENYEVSAVLLDDGLWKETKCSCPDGLRTDGKCKHVAAVLLKAASQLSAAPAGPVGSADQAQDLSKVKSDADTVICLDDDDVKEVKPVRAPQCTKRPAADAASTPLPDGAGAKNNAVPSPSPKERAATRKLPAWMAAGTAAAKKKAPGTAAVARATAKLANDAPAKRKAQPDDDDDGCVSLNTEPRARKTARQAPSKGKGSGSAVGGAASFSSSAARKATDYLPDDMGIDFLMELAGCEDRKGAEGAPQKAAPLRRCDTLPNTGSIAKPIAQNPAGSSQSGEQQRSKDRVQACLTDSRNEEAMVGDTPCRLSKHSSQSSAVPDTPEHSLPGGKSPCTGTVPEGHVDSSAKAATNMTGRSDSDSDSDEDPQEAFARKFRERMRGKGLQQSSQTALVADAAASGSMSAGKSGVPGQSGSAGGGHAKSPHGERASPKASTGAVPVLRPAILIDEEDDHITLGKLKQDRPSAREFTANSRPSSGTDDAVSPPARTRPTTTTSQVSSKPVVSLAERMKQLRGC